MDLLELKDILKEYSLKLSKKKGQSFLWEEKKLQQIIESGSLSKNDNVVEIGPGLGVLTKHLVKNVGNVQAVEIDERLVSVMKKRFKGINNLEIVNENAVNFIPSFAVYKIIANIPYYITSPLLRHFLMEIPVRPSLIVFLMQKEIAEKICNKQRLSVIALQVGIFGEAKIVSYIDRGCFYPIPKVDSAVLRIKVFNKPAVEHPRKFLQLVKQGFSQPRKKIINSLSASLQKNKNEVLSYLKATDISENRRAETLTVEEWEKLGNLIT